LLDELGDFGHDINTVKSRAERTLDKSFNSLAVGIGAVPQESYSAGLRPAVLGVTLNLAVLCAI
jgi:hypothetical protein